VGNAIQAPATDLGIAALLDCLPRRLGEEGGVLPALRRFLFSFPASSAAAAVGRKKSASKDGDTGIDVSTGSDARVSTSGGASFEDSVLFIVFSSNLIGLLCARTIHYQFYSW
jgi:hypothetical protein